MLRVADAAPVRALTNISLCRNGCLNVIVFPFSLGVSLLSRCLLALPDGCLRCPSPLQGADESAAELIQADAPGWELVTTQACPGLRYRAWCARHPPTLCFSHPSLSQPQPPAFHTALPHRPTPPHPPPLLLRRRDIEVDGKRLSEWRAAAVHGDISVAALAAFQQDSEGRAKWDPSVQIFRKMASDDETKCVRSPPRVGLSSGAHGVGRPLGFHMQVLQRKGAAPETNGRSR